MEDWILKIHPAGSLGEKLKTVEDVMLSEKIPFVNEKLEMKKALKILSDKKLETIIAINKKLPLE